MRTKALCFIAASLLAIAACGGDDSSSTAGGSGSGGSGTGGAGASGGSSGSGGASGSGASGGSAGSAGSSPSDGGPGGGGSGGGADVRVDTPTGMDAQADRPGTMDSTTTDTGSSTDAARDTTSDGTTGDTSMPPADGGASDATDAPPADGGASDAPTDAGAFAITSTAFTEGTPIPAAHTCAGTNVSPPLSWTPGPAGTLSYAVVLTDKTNNLVHSGIYDIPSSITSLPMNVEKVAMPSNPAGSKQVLAYNNMAGYAGPCPGATAHTYEFMVYAVDIGTLPGIMTSQKGAALVTALQAHDLATATLKGTATTLR